MVFDHIILHGYPCNSINRMGTEGFDIGKITFYQVSESHIFLKRSAAPYFFPVNQRPR
ncbi:hypothetical protein D3C87_1972260 [compost metagenome]